MVWSTRSRPHVSVSLLARTCDVFGVSGAIAAWVVLFVSSPSSTAPRVAAHVCSIDNEQLDDDVVMMAMTCIVEWTWA